MSNTLVKKHSLNVIGFPVTHEFRKLNTGTCVNWRRGSLRRYESLAGFAAKFCYLNRIGPNEFIRFFEKFIGHFRPHEFWDLLDRVDFDIDCFANIIGEPESYVDSMRQVPFRPPEAYVGTNAKLINKDSSIDIFYCPDCIKFGYHAIFHQLPWIKRCLIHGSALQRGDGVFHGSYVRRDVVLIKDVYGLLFGEVSKWNYEDYDSWINKGEFDGVISVALYQRAIEEVSLKKSLIEKKARQHGGATPNGTSQVYEILRRLGGESTIKLLDFGYQFESEYSTRNSTCLDKDYYDCLSSVASNIGEIADARKEWATLLGEKTAWSEIAVSAIEAMLKNHQTCWGLYSRIKRRPSTNIHKSDYDFLMRCQRVVDVRHLQEEWLVPWIHRESFMQFGRDSSFLSYYGYVGRKLESCGLANKVAVQKIAISPSGDAQVFSVEAWGLDQRLKDLLDLILRIRLVGQLWSIFNFEQKGDKSAHEWCIAKNNDGVDWCLYETASSSVELEIWSRHGEEMPDWVSLDRVQHNLEGQ